MFENLSEKLERSLKNLKGEGKITEINISETLKEVRRALLDADVSYKVAKEFCDNVKKKAIGSNVLTAVKPQQMMVKIVHDELTEFMGSESSSINLKGSPAVVLVAGLNGSGKTTFSGKLALYLKKKGSKVLLAACDTFRPAAIEQLKTLAEGIGINVFSIEGEKDPVKVANAAIAQARIEGYNVVIVDTAGRLAVDEELMQEIRTMHQAVKPSETLFVVDAMTGQDAVNVATSFNDQIGIDGVILTKLDGDTRGGAALSIRAVTGKPIYYVGMGEKLSDLEQFYPSRMASRILGMGDVESLIEKAQNAMDEEKAREMEQKMKKASFDFNDFLDSLAQMEKMGSMQDMLSMIPGMGNQLKNVEIDEKQMNRPKAIILSMTKEERSNPAIINPSRKRRIAAGAGVDISEVNRLIKQFDQIKKMMKQMSGMMGGKRGRRFRMPFGF